MTSPKLIVAYLVWAPSGTGYMRAYLDAYREHAARAAHDLHLIYNGFESDSQRQEFDAVAASPPHTKFETNGSVLDLEAYRQLVTSTDADYYLFLGSYTRPLVDGWLELLLRHQRSPEVGMVAPSGSYESISSGAPLATRLFRLTQFPAFPNPHLRTGAFMIQRDVINRMRWPKVRTKLDAWKLENGRRSFSAQVQALGLKTVVAGADGVAYEWPDWPKSNTFRSGEQENLVIADNRTDDWQSADTDERAKLSRLAWGSGEQ
ncbi:MAG: hypothetical protein ACPHCI_05340 [Solirubrobacterales bacterium]